MSRVFFKKRHRRFGQIHDWENRARAATTAQSIDALRMPNLSLSAAHTFD